MASLGAAAALLGPIEPVEGAVQHVQLKSQIQLYLRILVAAGRCKAAPPERIADEGRGGGSRPCGAPV